MKKFDELNRVDMHRLWFIEAKTEKKIAKMYGVTRQEVHDKRKNEFRLTFLNSAMLYLTNPKYKGGA